MAQISFFHTTPAPTIREVKQCAPIKGEIDIANTNDQLGQLNECLVHPSFFTGLSIFVALQNQDEKAVVENTLKVTGASIVNETNPMTDVIVTDSSNKKQTSHNIKSRGIRLTVAAGKAQTIPKIINKEQIPWAFMKERLNPSQDNLTDKQDAMIVVADATKKFRPMFKTIPKIPTLYFDKVPKNYFFSPLMQPPHDFEAFQKRASQYDGLKVIIREEPPDEGWCEICLRQYHNAKEHRESPEHIKNVNNPDTYAQVDCLISELVFDQI